jgi:serine phosphatase RsbU (regulator of sigma subunit)/Tfp pilus assembly protein PilF
MSYLFKLPIPSKKITFSAFIGLLLTANYNDLFSQSRELDSLQRKFRIEKTDTGKVMLACRISYQLQFSSPDDASKWAADAYNLAREIKFRKGEGRALIQLGNIEQTKGNLGEAEKYNTDAMALLSAEKDIAGLAISTNNLGIIEHSRGSFDKALSLYRLSLAASIASGRQQGTATSLLCIGTVHENLSAYDSAIVYYLRAEKIASGLSSSRLKAVAKTSLANVYLGMGNLALASKYNEEAIDLYMKEGNVLGLLKSYRSLGLISEQLGSLKEARWYYSRALEVSQQLGSQSDIAANLFSLGQLYENSNRPDSAYLFYSQAYNHFESNDYTENTALALVAMARIDNLRGNHNEAALKLEKALRTGNETKSPSVMTGTLEVLAETYELTGDFRSALASHKLLTAIRDSLMTAEKQKQILELQTQYETDKKEKENVILRKDQQILKNSRNSLIAGSAFLVLILFVIFRSLTIKKRDNRLLREQKAEIEKQKEIVEVQKTSITDSIKYAKRIQSAMLPPENLTDELLGEHFILYLPRDIVSGDFYWTRKISESKFLVCAADCTGHGVPGAFMSMLGMSALNDIVSKNFEEIGTGSFTTGKLLGALREAVKESLRQTGREGEARDGMDMSICLVDKGKRIVHYSGANNSVYLVSGANLADIKATRNPVGIYVNEVDFATNSIEYQPGSELYMFSDGFSDQIGEGGKKFLSKNFKNLLQSLSGLPMNEIHTRLKEAHLSWRKEEEQVDDILVIGIRL